MAKNVFRPGEIINLEKRVTIESPHYQRDTVPAELEEVEEVYMGPTADDLRREAEAFKADWEREKETMLASARVEAERIVKEAEAAAFEEMKSRNEESLKVREEAEFEAKTMLDDAKQRAERMEQESRERIAEVEKEAYHKGLTAGREEGFEEGKAEVERLVERLHLILSRAIDKRGEIIAESETQLVQLVLLIARKVVKVISENQKNVIVNNVIQALRKLKSRADVTIRVNLADLKITTGHVKDFIRLIENARNVTVMEDAGIERGGCIIETDFGQIDARISSQLHEIEEKIMELVPIRTVRSETRS